MRIVILILLSILAGAICYLSCRLHQGLVCFFPQIRFWTVMAVICSITLLLVAGFVRGAMPFSKDVKHILGLIGGFCMGIELYLLLFTAAADLLLLIPRLMKLPFTTHRLFKGYLTLGVLLLTALTCIGGFVNVQRIHHVSYEVRLQDKQDISDLSIVMISVDEINTLHPDLVCIAGDFFDTDFASILDPEAASQTLQKLQSAYGVYACPGNHDGGQTYEQMTAFLRKSNIRLLDDAYTVIDDRLILAGRLDASPIGGYGGQSRKELSDFLTGEDPALPVIVMDHNPANIDTYTTEADLILCGHTHKGQVFPGNLITDRMYTVDYGCYRKDTGSPYVIVTSGVGYWGMPIRVGSNCEVVSIHCFGDT